MYCAIIKQPISIMAFGFVDKIQNKMLFLFASFGLRIIEGAGVAAFYTSYYSLNAITFPVHRATMFSIFETSYGFGMIVGPLLGQVLYNWSGFVLPFALLGTCHIILAIFFVGYLPNQYAASAMEEHEQQTTFPPTAALKMVPILLDMYAVMCTLMGSGFLQGIIQELCYACTVVQVEDGA